MLQAKSAVFAAAAVGVAGVFFPLWFAVPVMTLIGAWGLGMCARRSEVVLDTDLGRLVVRLGPIARRVPLASITAIQVDRSKVSIARSGGAEISVYAWRKSRLDGWLRAPVVAGDIGHAISKAAAIASRDAAAAAPGSTGSPAVADGLVPRSVTGRWRLSRSRTATALTLLACMGLLEVLAAFLVRVSWPNPVMTALGVILALALGLSGVFYVLFTLWLLVTGRAADERRALV